MFYSGIEYPTFYLEDETNVLGIEEVVMHFTTNHDKYFPLIGNS